ncbi:MAG: hypothetical protein PHF86_01265 [Candidatus Nanoarchaeia archaeon]|nr:hypothetical protein [Candidatus Nanoarchaeia archaeon]
MSIHDENKKNLLCEIGFKKEVQRIDLGLCPFCGISIKKDDFRDELSKKEFKISGLCQKCQDKIFEE